MFLLGERIGRFTRKPIGLHVASYPFRERRDVANRTVEVTEKLFSPDTWRSTLAGGGIGFVANNRKYYTGDDIRETAESLFMRAVRNCSSPALHKAPLSTTSQCNYAGAKYLQQSASARAKADE